MICGGNVELYFLFIKDGDAAAIMNTQDLEAFITRGEQLWLVSDITPGHSGAMCLFGKKSGQAGPPLLEAVVRQLGDKTGIIHCRGRDYYCESIELAGMTYIFGGGHVTQALVPVLVSVDFRCVVLEDREALCWESLFPGAESVRLVDNENIFREISVSDDDYNVVMKRGHKHDQIVLEQLLRTPAFYIGAIGSKRIAAGVAENLRKAGFTHGDVARIHSPIGLAIGAETPAEIAVSIAAEMIKARAGRK